MTDTMLTVIVGIAVRLLVPIILTAIFVAFLHRLDTQWADEAEELMIEARKEAVAQETNKAIPVRSPQTQGA